MRKLLPAFARLFLLFASLLVFPATLLAQQTRECLVYDLSWTGIDVGRATQEVSADGRTRRVVATFHSNAWLSLFLPVDDRIESSYDVVGAPFPGITRTYRMRLSEGRYQRDREIIFAPEKGRARYHDRLTGEVADVVIPPPTYDIYGSFYFVRHLPLEVGKSVFVNVLDGKEARRVEVQVLRREKLRTIFGRVETIVVRPLVAREGVFEVKKGVTIWLTNDSRRIPVRVETKVTVGSVTASLVEMR
ncbi:MAG TPA: DUF3108 domain-containing protein [Geobacteraceae bacterium]